MCLIAACASERPLSTCCAGQPFDAAISGGLFLKPNVWVTRRQAGAVVTVGTVGSLLLLGAGSAVAASRPPSNARVAVSQGIGPAALRNARVVGKPAAAAPEQVSFVLNSPNLTTLEASVNAGTPGGHLSVAQFATKYGVSSANIAALTTYLNGFGIATNVLADHLDVSTTGTTADYNNALGITQSTFRVAAIPATASRAGRPAVQFHGTMQSPGLPPALAPLVLSILGLTSYPAGISQAAHTPSFAHGAKPAGTQTGNLTPASFSQLYNLNPLLKKGFKGQNQTVGIVTLASMRASDATHFWSKVIKIKTKANRLKLETVDGGSGAVSQDAGSGETTLDVEQSGALAPDANIVVYEAPNTDSGFVDAFATAASQNKASTVSSSWGQSETNIANSVANGTESSTYAEAFDEMFLELAAQGQSSFIAAGDSGAYDASGDLGSTNLSVDVPGASPWTTDAGGQTLAGKIPVTAGVTNTVASRRAWGWDWLWPDWKKLGSPSEFAFAKSAISGGGGGYSSTEARPGYQQRWVNVGEFSAVEYLTPVPNGTAPPTTWTFTAHPTVTTGTAAGRAVPDVSADADPFTGYEEYFSGFSGAKLQDGWGGTSFVAPQLAGATAVIDSYVGHRVGFWNPSIYRFASWKSSPFSPIETAGTSSDNLFFSGTQGHRYSPATGLGSPNFAKLAVDFKR
jgi:kumamolisin